MGFPLNVRLEEMLASPYEAKLLLALFYAMDGINEYGLAVAVAGVIETSVKPECGEESVFITYLIRKILDQTKPIDEAVDLVEKFIHFDLHKNYLNGHFLIADVSGRSVILEYVEDQWRRIVGDKSWQVLTTKPIYNVPGTKLRDQCWRYRSISKTLEKTKGNVDWKAGMNILKDVTQKGTIRAKELYF